MDLKTLWKCRNGIVEYLEENPESPQKEVLQTLLINLIKELKDKAQQGAEFRNKSEEWNKNPVTFEDDEDKMIEGFNFGWDMLAFSTGIYPAVTKKEITETATKLDIIGMNSILRHRVASASTILSFFEQAKESDLTAVTEAERVAIDEVYGEDGEVVSIDEFLDYVIEHKEEDAEVLI